MVAKEKIVAAANGPSSSRDPHLAHAEDQRGVIAEQQPAPHPANDPYPALKLRRTLQGHTAAIYRMALSPDGRTLASPSSDALLWDVERGRLLRTLEHQAAVICAAWSPDGTTLASGRGGKDNDVYLWDAATGRRMRVLKAHGKKVNGVAWSPDGKTLASCS